MSSFSKQILSGSTNGRLIKVAATATAGTLIHTAGAGAVNMDELWLYAVNSDNGNDHVLTIEYGGVGAPDDLIEVTVAAETGLALVVPGLILQNSLVVRAFAVGAANLLMVGGFVNRITV